MARTPEEREALIDKILDEYEGAVDKYNRDQWNSAYGEKLGGYADKMKALKGDDYDIMNESYDEYNSSYKDMSPDEYIGKCTEYMDDLFERLKAAVAEGDVEEVAEVTEEIKEEAAEQPESEDGEVTEVSTTDPEVAEDITDAVEDKASDEGLKEQIKEETNPGEDKDFSLIKPRGDSASKDTNGWTGSPHTSGGRNGKASDELLKEGSDEKTEGSNEKIVAEEQQTDDEPQQEEENKSEDNSQKRMGDAMKKLGNAGSSLKVEQSVTKGKNDELADFANSVRSAKAKYGA